MKIASKGIIHQSAFCQDCGKTNEYYIKSKAKKWGYNHAKSTGHTVIVETGTSVHYNPKS